MATHNAKNERLKRDYLAFLKEAKRYSEPSVDAAAKAISRFEAFNRFKDFRAFHHQQAVAFKKMLSNQTAVRSGDKLSKATLFSTLSQLQKFFFWLAGRPGYRNLSYSDADYFNLSEKETRVATAHREQRSPTLEEVKHVIRTMRCTSDLERRDRALLAFILLTGARDSAVASLKLKHIDLVGRSVFQDAREVKTKFSKTFVTYFFPVGAEINLILDDWVNFLLESKSFNGVDPLFPATAVATGEDLLFQAVGVSRKHWSNASAIRNIFRSACQEADVPYFNPHSLRKTLARLGQQVCRTPEEYKAWSQNLGHDEVLTTFCSYGAVQADRQGDIIRGLEETSNKASKLNPAQVLAQLAEIIGKSAEPLSGDRFTRLPIQETLEQG